MDKKIQIVPSILSANFIKLGDELKKCESAGIKMLHFDVMDFDFVPNLTFGSKILTDIVENFNFNIDIHFMVKIKTKSLNDFFCEFIKCKPLMMTMHIEALSDDLLYDFINLCIKNNIKPSLAISPNTQVSKIEKFLPLLSNVLVMSVYPGFGGQSFIDSSIEKIKKLRTIRSSNNYNFSIEVDGGINSETAKKVIEAGAEILVAGSYLFNADNFDEKVKTLNG